MLTKEQIRYALENISLVFETLNAESFDTYKTISKFDKEILQEKYQKQHLLGFRLYLKDRVRAFQGLLDCVDITVSEILKPEGEGK